MHRLLFSFVTLWFIPSMAIAAPKSLSFTQALALAYAHNPVLQVQIQEAEIAKGQIIQRGLWPNPSFSVEGENIGGSGAFKSFESAETTLSVTQPIPLGHQLHYNQLAAIAQYQQLLLNIQKKKAEIYAQVGRQYVDVLYTMRWVVVLQQLVDINRKVVQYIAKNLDQGTHSKLDLKLAEIALGRIEIDATKAQRVLKHSRVKLAQLLGESKELTSKLSDTGFSHRIPSWSWIEKRIDSSVFLATISLQLRAKRADITAIKHQVWPSVNLQLGGRHFADDGEKALVVSASSDMPFFNRNQGNIRSAESEYTQLCKLLQVERLSLYQRLYGAYLSAKQHAMAIKTIKKDLIPAATEAVDLATEGYQKGRYSYILLANALQALAEEERHLQEVHAKQDKALIEIHSLLMMAEK
jgi:outer membrane protein, heavy metal efflux system